jgi:Spy/CpxP family protein refolding chaperone
MVYNGPAAREFGTDTTQARTAWKYGWIILGVLAVASLLAQYGGSGETRLQATMKAPAQQPAALDSLRAFLNLSDAQIQRLQSLNEQSRTSMKAISERARANQAALHQLLNSTAEPDAAKADALVLEAKNLRMQLQNSCQELAAKATTVLTPEQQQRLAALSSTIAEQREAAPGLMPESWPLLNAAAQLGLIAPGAQK